MKIAHARAALDATIDNARGQNYKAIHVAEILYRDRTEPGALDPLKHESYRCASKRWRDTICERLGGSRSRSNDRWQDGLFTRTSTPRTLAVLADENRRLGGAVEAYIYRRVGETLHAVAALIADLEQTTKRPFSLAWLLRRTRQDVALCRVAERVFEIAAYAVLDTLVERLGVMVRVEAPAERLELLDPDDRFFATVLRAGPAALPLRTAGRLARVGVINAADGGLDLTSNFGFGAQVKSSVLSARRVAALLGRAGDAAETLICRSAVMGRDDDMGALRVSERVISETDLVRWADLLVSGRFGPDAERALRRRLAAELRREFPGCRPDAFTAFMRERGYDKKPEWKVEAA